MLGSLTLYRRLLLENVFSRPEIRRITPFAAYQKDPSTLPSFGHGIAGIMAGTTVSFIAAPVEHVKARLQIQYAADKAGRLYSGPIDCTKKLVSLPLSIKGKTNRADYVARHAWNIRIVSRTLCDHLIPLLLLLLVGFVRRADSDDARAHQHVGTGHQLLGGGRLGPDLLDHLIPVGRGETAPDDGPDGWGIERRTTTVPGVERCGDRCI